MRFVKNYRFDWICSLNIIRESIKQKWLKIVFATFLPCSTRKHRYYPLLWWLEIALRAIIARSLMIGSWTWCCGGPLLEVVSIINDPISSNVHFGFWLLEGTTTWQYGLPQFGLIRRRQCPFKCLWQCLFQTLTSTTLPSWSKAKVSIESLPCSFQAEENKSWRALSTTALFSKATLKALWQRAGGAKGRLLLWTARPLLLFIFGTKTWELCCVGTLLGCQNLCSLPNWRPGCDDLGRCSEVLPYSLLKGDPWVHSQVYWWVLWSLCARVKIVSRSYSRIARRRTSDCTRSTTVTLSTTIIESTHRVSLA